MALSKPNSSVSWWFVANQIAVVLLLLSGYTGYYFCRTFFNVIKPELVADYELTISLEQLGLIASVGTLFYAIGKVISGIIGDFFGGKLLFVVGMLVSTVSTIYFGLGTGFTIFFAAWVLNRFAQSGGWNGLVKIAANWFSYRQYGTVMATLSLSYLFGDAIARYSLGLLLNEGLGWRTVCFFSAAILAGLSILCWLLLRQSPPTKYQSWVYISPTNLHGNEGTQNRPPGIIELLSPYFRSPSFWMIILLSFGLTLLRETFNEWSTVFLAQTLRLSSGDSAIYSAIFPLSGGVSAIVMGLLSDTLGKGKRGPIIAGCSLILAFTLGVAWQYIDTSDPVTSLYLLGITGFFLIGPYSFLAGAVSIDLGGRTGSSSAAGLIDAIGYLGGVFAGYGIAKWVSTSGWQFTFYFLAFVALGCCICALVYWYLQEFKPYRQISEHER